MFTAEQTQKLVGLMERAMALSLEHYQEPVIKKSLKLDQSPVTAADLAVHDLFKQELAKNFPKIPLLSEEEVVSYQTRKDWETFFILDPIDGTKEFIKKNGEFAIALGLVHQGRPVFGCIGAPCWGQVFFNFEGRIFKKALNKSPKKLDHLSRHSSQYVYLVSRSHGNDEQQKYIEEQSKSREATSVKELGSCLKFCALLLGDGDEYIRFAPTMEWDVAAGEALVNCMGFELKTLPDLKVMRYNKEVLKNPSFIVKRKE